MSAELIQILLARVEELAERVHDLEATAAHQETPWGQKVFLISDNAAGNLVSEVTPTYSGTNPTTTPLSDIGSGITRSFLDSRIIDIPATARGSAVLQIDQGTTRAYIRFPQGRLLYGVVQSVATCNAFCTVKQCKLDGTIIDDTLITINPVMGATAEAAANGFAIDVGDIIAYEPLADDPTQGVQVGAYKTVSLGYRCSDSSSASVGGLNRLTLYNGDFFIKADSDCGGSFTNVGHIYWRGFLVKGYSTGGGTVTCGAPTADSTAGVKLLDLDSAFSAGRTAGANDARIAFNLQPCATTTANVPTIGGAPCSPDESGPLQASFMGFLPTTEVVKSIDSATAVCNEDGTITVTINFTTARAAVAFT